MKYMIQSILVFAAAVMVCHAQTVNISGVVKNSAGSGITGVTVRLGKADRATITGSDGSFKLTEFTTGIKRYASPAAFNDDCPFLLSEKGLYFKGAQQVNVTVKVFECNGTLLSSLDNIISSPNRLMALAPFETGVHIYRVSMNNKHYTLKNVAVATTNRGTASSWKKITPIALAKETARIDDALLFTKEGYQLYRIAVKKPDTSGIQITMISLVTGSVTDAGGNVYKTVQIGNQTWITENLRATKYNDNTAIPIVSDKAAWSKLSTAGCCFYNNTTDTAAQRKWGAIYNWYAVKTGKLAMTGWHVATDGDFDTLTNYLIKNGYNYDGTLLYDSAGTTYQNKISKSVCAKTDWLADTSDTGAIGNDLSKNNACGLSILPAGDRYYDGGYADQTNFSYLWTGTERDGSYAWYRMLWTVNRDLYRNYRVKSLGCSVRLVRNN